LAETTAEGKGINRISLAGAFETLRTPNTRLRPAANQEADESVGDPNLALDGLA
jgi:hypothetical protein